MKVIGVIPARYASVRFPGKPLAPLAGRPMVLHVLAAARAARRLDRVIVATDDSRIAEVVRGDGGEAVLTSPEAASGTDRLAEAALRVAADVYVNLQGDEPLMAPENVDLVVETLLAGADREIATVALPAGVEVAGDPDVVKVVIAADGRALYFSRAGIPFPRAGRPAYRKHLGLYAYRAETLQKLAALPPSPLERIESLEQLRWLEAGWTIWVGEAVRDSIGVDRPEDLARAEKILQATRENLEKEAVQ
ncbi:MAG TPA: 3-deoxy-manno-octulosonate cytidylyltransferase [Thermoanaerobaculia bacterium]|nr:3-deoxy-manno-octulosonate cytidylyltransferase [Thermoanaerobaculia bacterium]